MNYNIWNYCNEDQECPPGLDKCHVHPEASKGGKIGICGPLGCKFNDLKSCPDLGCLCSTGCPQGILTGQCSINGTCDYSGSVLVAGCV